MENTTADKQRNTNPNSFAGSGWIFQSIAFGLILFVIMFIGYPSVTGDEITWKSIIAGLVASTVGGFVYGLTMKLLYRKKVARD